MENLKLLPDVVAYNTLIDWCFEWQGSSDASKLIEEMSEKGVKTMQLLIIYWLSSFVRRGRWKKQVIL